MRSSLETDRTQVATASNSREHIETLEVKDTSITDLQGHLLSPQLGSGINAFTSRSHRESKDMESGETDNDSKDPNLTEWDGPHDPGNPMHWPVSKKWRVTIALGAMTLCVTFASSVFSNATMAVAELYHVSTVTATLGTSLFVLGFAFGPLLWGPGSEVFGRKPPLFFGYFCFAVFQIPVAVARNIETIMLCRFFGGLFASAPLAIVGGTLADFWGPVDRGVAVCVFAASVFIGPIAGPIMSGLITQSHLGWRWTAWITLIMAAFFGTIAFLLVPESSHPVLLQKRAKKIRFETKNWATHSHLDTIRLDPQTFIQTYLVRPFVMLFREPILLLITVYLALIYGILYLFFESFPLSFQEERGWNQGVGALPFIGIAIGVVLGCITITWITKTRFARKLEKHGRVIPEERLCRDIFGLVIDSHRLPPMILGSFILPIGLFWFAWTSSPNITWVPQVIASVPIGWGILMIFLQGMNYIIDVYMWHANSAIAANNLLRSTAGAGFPLFAVQMYHKLGVAWASSLLGFLCIAMIPAPILFYIYGARIRKLSKVSPTN